MTDERTNTWTTDGDSLSYDGTHTHMNVTIYLTCSPFDDIASDPMDDPLWIEQQKHLAGWLNHIAPDGLIPAPPVEES